MPDWVRYVRERLPISDFKTDRARDTVEELASQLEEVYRTALAQGSTEDEAVAETRDHITNWDKLADDISRAAPSARVGPVPRLADNADANARRRGRAGVWLADLGLDIRYALRTLVGKPGFSVAVILLIALGVGANATVFSVLDAVFLKPLTYPEPRELVVLYERSERGAVSPASWPNYLDWRTNSQSFEHVGAYSSFGITVTDGDSAEVIDGARATASIFDMFDVPPALGRTFLPNEDASDLRVVVLSHDLWTIRYGSDPDVIGREIRLNGAMHTIIGVMPEGFTIPSPYNANLESRLWVPFTAEVLEEGRGSHSYPVMARLRDSVTVDEARADMNRVALNLAAAYPETNQSQRVLIREFHADLFGDVGSRLVLVLGAAGLVLLIACGNVAGLQLARSTARRTEIALRAAMGASRGRLIRLFLAESSLLALAGGGAALVVTFWGVSFLRESLPPSIPRTSDIGIDGPVLLFAFAALLLTTVIFGLVPALSATRRNHAESLREGGGRISRRTRLQGVFVVGQLALTLMLVHTTSLLVGSFMLLSGTEFGFETENALTFSLTLASTEYDDVGDREEFLKDLTTRLEALPGVTKAAAVNRLPFEGGTNGGIIVEGRDVESDPSDRPLVERKVMIGDYLGAAGIPLRAGRILESADSTGATAGAIINERMAEQLWPDEDPLGKRFSSDSDPVEWVTVVGVAANVRMWGAESRAIAEAYRPYNMMARRRMFVVLRTVVEPTSVVPSVRQEIAALDPNLPLTRIRTMEDVLGSQLSGRKLITGTYGLFAVLAMLLGVAGVYGVVSFFVAQRTNEFGVRIALGAGRGRLMSLVLAKGARLAGLAVVLGTAGSYAAAQVTGSALYGFSSTDPRFAAGVAALLVVVALVATLLPARRATKVDPARALQNN